MFCVNCQKDVDPEIVSGANIYGPHFAFASALYARCSNCGNYGEYATDNKIDQSTASKRNSAVIEKFKKIFE